MYAYVCVCVYLLACEMFTMLDRIFQVLSLNIYSVEGKKFEFVLQSLCKIRFSTTIYTANATQAPTRYKKCTTHKINSLGKQRDSQAGPKWLEETRSGSYLWLVILAGAEEFGCEHLLEGLLCYQQLLLPIITKETQGCLINLSRCEAEERRVWVKNKSNWI